MEWRLPIPWRQGDFEPPAARSDAARSTCVQDAEPCLEALTQSASGLDLSQQRDQWGRVKELMRDARTVDVALGAFDAQRMKRDYELVASYFSPEHPFDVARAHTNEFLDAKIKMTADGARQGPSKK